MRRSGPSGPPLTTPPTKAKSPNGTTTVVPIGAAHRLSLGGDTRRHVADSLLALIREDVTRRTVELVDEYGMDALEAGLVVSEKWRRDLNYAMSRGLDGALIATGWPK